MTRRRTVARKRGRGRAPRRRRRTARIWPSAGRRRRWLHAFRRAPRWLQLAAAALAAAMLAASVNGVYQVIRKPTELFFPVAGSLHKTPAATWDAYGPLFRRHATEVVTADFLAALAQVEGSGNPVARTYWRWSFGVRLFDIYRPASSAVGMYQITDGTFEQAKRYCIHDHAVAEVGAWWDWRACWFNSLYFRVVPSHAVELTSAYLDRSVSRILARHGIERASRAAKQDLAALIHLCGAAAGDRHARAGLGAPSGLRCGSHDAQRYLARVAEMKHVFTALAARDR